jgi:hypothetical protein
MLQERAEYISKVTSELQLNNDHATSSADVVLYFTLLCLPLTAIVSPPA